MTDDDITAETGTRHGIEHWARRGIAERRVLVDFARWAKTNRITTELGTRYAISLVQFKEATQSQGVQFQIGDILLFRTGWIEWYNSLTPRQQFELGHTSAFQCIGLLFQLGAARF